MASPAHRTTRATPRPQRADGRVTRAQILEAAGRVYAEKGYARTTGKEICARAGVNMAAINYHFGDKGKLYDEVLIEAHRQLVSLDELQTIDRLDVDAIDKLRQIVGGVFKRAIDPDAPWGVRVLAREIMSWSSHGRTLLERAVLPKALVIRRLVAAVLGLPESNVAVQCCLPLVLAPAMIMVIAPPYLRRTALPAIEQESDALIDVLGTYMRAGLQAVRRTYSSSSVIEPAPPRGQRRKRRSGSR